MDIDIFHVSSTVETATTRRTSVVDDIFAIPLPTSWRLDVGCSIALGYIVCMVAIRARRESVVRGVHAASVVRGRESLLALTVTWASFFIRCGSGEFCLADASPTHG